MKILSRMVVVPLLAMALVAANARAQEFPNRAVRIYTTAPGGGSDFSARIISQTLPTLLGQSVIVENRGGTVVIAATAVMKSPADGHALLLYGSTFWLFPYMQDSVPYDPLRDFVPITMTNLAPNILVVHPSLPVRSVKELIALAASRPGELNFSTGPSGSSNHLSGELLKAMARVKIVRVPYKGTAPALTALLGGEVQMMFGTASTVAPYRTSGRLRALAVTSAKPSPFALDLPSISAALPGYDSVAQSGIFAPAGTPAAVIQKLNQDIVQVLRRADVKEKFFNSGTEAIGSTADEFAAAIKAEMAGMGKVIRDEKIRAE
jgi:tripartite-type tricarboxylate transporter receptor subunit TctC